MVRAVPGVYAPVGQPLAAGRQHAHPLHAMRLSHRLQLGLRSGDGPPRGARIAGVSDGRGSDRPAFEVPEDLFAHIVGHDDVKRLLRFGLKARRPVHFLLYGPAASAKSLFLMDLERLPGAYYGLGSTTSRAGLRQTLLELRPSLLLIDELEKIHTMRDYAVLLSAMETGITTQTMFDRHDRISHHVRVVAAANDISKVAPELRSRFSKVQFRPYTPEEFLSVAAKVVEHYEGVATDVASKIALAVWNDLRSRDVRDAVRVARMLEDPNDLPDLIALLKRLQ